MIRVFGQELDREKVIDYSLLKVFGIGQSRAAIICKDLQISGKRTRDLSEEYQNMIQKKVAELGYVVEEELRRQLILQNKIDDSINCYRAIRKRNGLPCNGQQTRRNARTTRRRRAGK